MTSLAAALHAFQKDAPPVHLDAVNPHFKNKYASLGGVIDAIRPALNKAGLAYTQFPSHIDGQPALRTVLLCPESGETLEDTTPLILPKNDPQGQGSALTYARRYALLSVLGLVGDEDDDANAASKPAQRPVDTNGYSESRADAQPADTPPGQRRVHFGKNAGKTLGELSVKTQQWYAAEWSPDTSKYPIKAEDAALRAAARTLCGLDPVETTGPFADSPLTPDLDDSIPF